MGSDRAALEEARRLASDDRDYWFRIPDFDGCSPSSVEFKGYAGPIIQRPGIVGEVTASSMADIVGCTRMLAEKRFGTIERLNDCFQRYWRAYEAAADAAGGEPEEVNVSLDEGWAGQYMNIMGRLEVAWHSEDADEVLFNLSFAVSLLLNWMMSDVSATVEAAEKGKPFIERRGRPLSPKTAFYLAQISLHPRLGNRELADQILARAPKGDDGQSPFYWTGVAWHDREMGEQIDVLRMTMQIQKARERHYRKTDRKAS